MILKSRTASGITAQPDMRLSVFCVNEVQIHAHIVRGQTKSAPHAVDCIAYVLLQLLSSALMGLSRALCAELSHVHLVAVRGSVTYEL